MMVDTIVSISGETPEINTELVPNPSNPTDMVDSGYNVCENSIKDIADESISVAENMKDLKLESESPNENNDYCEIAKDIVTTSLDKVITYEMETAAAAESIEDSNDLSENCVEIPSELPCAGITDENNDYVENGIGVPLAMTSEEAVEDANDLTENNIEISLVQTDTVISTDSNESAGKFDEVKSFLNGEASECTEAVDTRDNEKLPEHVIDDSCHEDVNINSETVVQSDDHNVIHERDWSPQHNESARLTARETVRIEKNWELNVKSVANNFGQIDMKQQGDNCVLCRTRVYPMEMLKADGKIYHRFCFKCSKCKKQLTPSDMSVNSGKLYCKPHFMELFKLRGRYDETESTQDRVHQNGSKMHEELPASDITKNMVARFRDMENQGDESPLSSSKNSPSVKKLESPVFKSSVEVQSESLVVDEMPPPQTTKAMTAMFRAMETKGKAPTPEFSSQIQQQSKQGPTGHSNVRLPPKSNETTVSERGLPDDEETLPKVGTTRNLMQKFSGVVAADQ